MRISHKLFLLLIVTSSLAILMLAAFAHWSFKKTFIDFLNAEQTRQMEIVANELADRFNSQGSLELSDRQWRVLLSEAVHQSKSIMPRPPPAPRPVWREISLFDADGSTLQGPLTLNDSLRRVEIRSAGQVIGYIAAPPFDRPRGRRAQAFQRRQTLLVSVAAAIVIVLSGFTAFWGAKRFSKPIRSLATSMRLLAGGDYSQQLPERRTDELGQLMRDFNVLARTLDQNESARRRWFADVSHELRTPLAIIRGEIEAIEDGVREPNRQAIGSLANEVRSLSKLIDDLYQLAIADIGGLNYSFSQCCVSEIVERAVDAFNAEYRSASRDLERRVSPEVQVLGDASRLLQLFENLLANSLNHGNNNALTRVSLTVSDEQRAIILIEDSGPGVSPSALPRLFDPLFREDNEATGSGLGLAICQRIVEAHGGSISAEPSELGGLAIKIEIATLLETDHG
ncbi:MAG: ATP-binding protein [Pseudomonadota bacterium]